LGSRLPPALLKEACDPSFSRRALVSAPRSSNGEMSGCSHHGTTTVVGSGHSAINVVLALLDLQADAPRTEVLWALRSNRIEKLLGGGLNNQLPQRGELGLAAKEAIDAGRLRMLAPFAAERVTETGGRLLVEATLDGASVIEEVGRIVVATRFRPDFSFLREVRLALDPAVEAPPALAPFIDPNFHS
jgi:hypothetical protein